MKTETPSIIEEACRLREQNAALQAQNAAAERSLALLSDELEAEKQNRNRLQALNAELVAALQMVRLADVHKVARGAIVAALAKAQTASNQP